MYCNCILQKGPLILGKYNTIQHCTSLLATQYVFIFRKAYGLTGKGASGRKQAAYFLQLIYSHYAALQTSMRGFLPHRDTHSRKKRGRGEGRE